MPSTNHGSRQPAADESRGLSYLDAGRRLIVADSIRNMGQEDWAALMPNRNPRTNDFTLRLLCEPQRVSIRRRTVEGWILKSGSPMRCSESFRRRGPGYLPFRGWICQETLCDGSPVTFDLRQCGSPTCPQHKIWVTHQRCRTLRSPTRRASWTVACETPGNRPA